MAETVSRGGIYEAAYPKPTSDGMTTSELFDAFFGAKSLAYGSGLKEATVTVSVLFDPSIVSLEQIARRVRERLRGPEVVPNDPPPTSLFLGIDPKQWWPKHRFAWRARGAHAWGSEEYV